MATCVGTGSQRLTSLRALATVKGRRQQRRFAFEGATLLAEAHGSTVPIEELYVTQAAYDAMPLARELDASGTPTFIVDDRDAAKISDLETPTGIVAVAPLGLRRLDEVLAGHAPVLVLADLNDPGNAGTLLRSADAFGCAGVVFGRLGVDPYHPKVVRGAMGAIFRVPIALADPEELASAAAPAGFAILGLAAGGERLDVAAVPPASLLVVGHERHGLGRWAPFCSRRLAIPMTGPAESLNAAVAGSIALYEAARKAE